MDHPLTTQNTQAMQDIMQHTIYLMGFSFILGSIFTIILLLALDFVRRNKGESA